MSRSKMEMINELCRYDGWLYKRSKIETLSPNSLNIRLLIFQRWVRFFFLDLSFDACNKGTKDLSFLAGLSEYE